MENLEYIDHMYCKSKTIEGLIDRKAEIIISASLKKFTPKGIAFKPCISSVYENDFQVWYINTGIKDNIISAIRLHKIFVENSSYNEYYFELEHENFMKLLNAMITYEYYEINTYLSDYLIETYKIIYDCFNRFYESAYNIYMESDIYI